MAHTLILKGRPGIGKTTLIKAAIQQLADRAGGFYTEEILGPGGRKGFRLITLTNRSVVMAHVDLDTRVRIGRFGVNLAAIDEVGVTALRDAIEQKPIVIIDEIGKLELASPQFQNLVIKAIGSSKLVLATAMKDNHPWLAALQSLPLVTVWEVTLKNRTPLIAQVLEWIDQRAEKR